MRLSFVQMGIGFPNFPEQSGRKRKLRQTLGPAAHSPSDPPSMDQQDDRTGQRKFKEQATVDRARSDAKPREKKQSCCHGQAPGKRIQPKKMWKIHVFIR
ncbi:hypothetical protein [Zoogloea sp.]|uniref:hypothetical protein n=1 Tax=Zoogloea sp. TaxID=49181 RepID=UPI002BE465CD|nr:hypothetical protein [Zoogloea sp.]HQA12302.1 hypothetical protein [Zoogloea sp.]HQE39481.1 hypothetical protein [Zoogloea sp.]